VPAGSQVHAILDNYATHKTPKIKAWLARRPHWHVHFTPTSASWIYQVERWFAELTRKQLQRGVHRSTADLEADIAAFIDAHNENPKPYRWVKSADEILASVKRFCQRTQQNLCGLRCLCLPKFNGRVWSPEGVAAARVACPCPATCGRREAKYPRSAQRSFATLRDLAGAAGFGCAGTLPHGLVGRLACFWSRAMRRGHASCILHIQTEQGREIVRL
jgi:DDE superfamily endonuclease